MAQTADIRLGPYWLSLAEGLDDPQLGFSFRRFPVARRGESLLAPSQVADGTPSLRNIRSDDLRWVQTDFGGGSGQRVFVPGDEAGATRFLSSSNIDFATPGELRLARAMAQVGATGTAAVTYQGDTFTDAVGSSTVVNTTDRRINSLNDIITKDTASLSAGTYVFDFFGYLTSPAVTDGSSMVEDLPTVTFPGTTAKLVTVGSRARTGNQTPCPTGKTNIPVDVTFTLHADSTATTATWDVKFRISVYDQTNTNEVAHKFATVRCGPANNLVDEEHTVSFTAASPSTNYRYRAALHSFTYVGGGTAGNIIEPLAKVKNWSAFIGETKEVLWEVKQGSTVIASGTSELTSTTSSKIASATVVVAAPAVYTMRLKWKTGSSLKPVLDRTTSTSIVMGDPYLAELGVDDRIYLVDYNASATPSVFWWDRQNAKWSAIGTFSVSGAKAVAMAHSDNYEFIAMDNKIIYRAKRPSTTAAVTAATTDPIVGMAVGGGRLWVLTMSTANGPQLFEGDSLEAGTITLTLRSTGMSLPKGNQADITLPNQIAGTGDGCVFFANDGPDCRVYRYTATGTASGTNLVDGGLPRGFRGRAIAHGLGYTWLAGSFIATGTDGQSAHRPAIMVIDPDGNASEIDVKLMLEDENSSAVQAIQLYGTDLWVLTHDYTPGTTSGKLWRVDLENSAAFLHHTITLDETQVGGSARGLAVTWYEKCAVWSKGSPYLELSDYQVVGELVSSRYTFGLTEQKVLYLLDLVTDCPAGTSVEVFIAADDGDWQSLGVVTGSESIPISSPGTTYSATWVQFKVRLLSDDATKTPIVQQVGIRAFLNEWRWSWEILLQCANATANYHLDGEQLPGAEVATRVFDLVREGGVVEFEDRYSDPANPATYIVQLTDPEQILTNAGESFVRLILVER